MLSPLLRPQWPSGKDQSRDCYHRLSSPDTGDADELGEAVGVDSAAAAVAAAVLEAGDVVAVALVDLAAEKIRLCRINFL